MALRRWTLDEARSVRLSPAKQVLSWGPTLILAPHPDDESLGCGGVIALLRKANVRVEIAWLTDGRRSHPNSRAYPGPKLAALRRKEAIAAARILGVKRWHFLDLEDCRIPFPPQQSIVAKLRSLLRGMQVVLTPWRLDPHCDHRTAFSYVMEASRQLPLQIIEYPIWLWENGKFRDHPRHDKFTMTRIKITDALPQKLAAIAAHRSQVTKLIADDPDGFCVLPRMLAHFQRPWELFLTSR